MPTSASVDDRVGIATRGHSLLEDAGANHDDGRGRSRQVEAGVPPLRSDGLTDEVSPPPSCPWSRSVAESPVIEQPSVERLPAVRELSVCPTHPALSDGRTLIYRGSRG